MRLIEAGGQSGGRGHGRDRRGQQSLADHVRPQPVETDQMVLPDQLHDRGGQRELTARKAPVTFLDRADPRVQRGSDAKDPVQLGHQHQPAVLGQRPVRDPCPGIQPGPALARRAGGGTTTRYLLHQTGVLSHSRRLGVGTSIFSNRKRTCRRISYRSPPLPADSSQNGQKPVVIHLGDHDPSGIDMTRDIGERLALFGADVEVRRIALNMDQVDAYDPPPNPAKLTDSRATAYIREYGRSSWELDALDPTSLDQLIEDEIDSWRDDDLWDRATQAMWQNQALLELVSQRWPEVAALVAGRQS
ncbi:hypothetical protein ABZ468_48860 [Streptomyces sp. NPDC005708]|uniref:hypothetical protein n=1 Tax=Streptomyces sp. NPDC005708 TaxID=3154564 RepID=UPI0033C3DDDB